MKKLNSQGIAHLQLIIIAVLLIGTVSLIVWRATSSSDDSETSQQEAEDDKDSEDQPKEDDKADNEDQDEDAETEQGQQSNQSSNNSSQQQNQSTTNNQSNNNQQNTGDDSTTDPEEQNQEIIQAKFESVQHSFRLDGGIEYMRVSAVINDDINGQCIISFSNVDLGAGASFTAQTSEYNGDPSKGYCEVDFTLNGLEGSHGYQVLYQSPLGGVGGATYDSETIELPTNNLYPGV